MHELMNEQTQAGVQEKGLEFKPRLKANPFNLETVTLKVIFDMSTILQLKKCF